MKLISQLKYIQAIIYPAWKWFVLLFFLIELEHLTAFFVPYLAKLVFDELLIEKNIHRFLLLTLSYSLVYLYSQCQMNISQFIQTLYLENSERKYREKFMSLVFQKNWKEFKAVTFGDISMALSDSIRDINMFVITILEILIGRPLFLIFAFGYLMSVSPLFLVLIAAEAIVSFVIIHLSTNPLEAVYEKKLEGTAIYNRFLENTYNGFEDTRLNLISSLSLTRLFKSFSIFRNRNVQDKKYNSIYMFAQDFKGVLFDIGALFIAVHFINKGTMTVGDYIAFIGLKPACCGVFNGFTHLILNFKLLGVAIQSIHSIIPFDEYSQCIPSSKPDIPDQPIRSIHFENISFQYDLEKPFISNLSIAFNAGTVCLITGNNGIGKTTLIRLMTGLCKPQSGNVLINGQTDIRFYTEAILSQHIKVLSQNPILYDDTIALNIFLTDSVTPKMRSRFETIREVLQLQEILEHYPNGENSNIFETGVTLSGGQIKKIALARVLVHDPDVAIFDEPFAGLDQKSQIKLEEFIHHFKKNKVVIIITHQNIETTFDRFIRVHASINDNGMFQLIESESDRSDPIGSMSEKGESDAKTNPS